MPKLPLRQAIEMEDAKCSQGANLLRGRDESFWGSEPQGIGFPAGQTSWFFRVYKRIASGWLSHTLASLLSFYFKI